MKRKFILALSLCMMGTTMFAQPKGATEPQLLVKAPVGLMAPVWSPTGDKIAVTADNYCGIFVVNVDGSNMTTISTEFQVGVPFKVRVLATRVVDLALATFQTLTSW